MTLWTLLLIVLAIAGIVWGYPKLSHPWPTIIVIVVVVICIWILLQVAGLTSVRL